MEYYLNRFKSTVSTVAAQVSNALPGNPIFREYEVQGQIGSAGPGMSWKIYSGTKNSTKQAVSIWLFDKKQIERWPRQEKEEFPERLKRGISQLTRLRHPRLMVIERALEESRDTFAFCSEPIFASLANIFGQGENLPSHLKDFAFEDVEIRHGLFQLSEALVFLHNDAKIVHANICPSSIVINEKGAWKLAGFDFCISGVPGDSGKITFPTHEWERRLMSVMNPDLNYAAPEMVEGAKCDVFADMYSLGVLSYALFNDSQPIFDNKSMLDTYRSNIDKLKKLSLELLKNIPAVFKEDLKMCLNFTPELRPDAIQFTRILYFDDPQLKIFNCLDALMQMDNPQKMQFFKGLLAVLGNFPKRPLLQKVLPYLTAEFSTTELVPFILPSVFLIAEMASDKEFASIILPPLIPIFAIQRPYQTVLILLQKIPLLLEKTPEADIKNHVLPLVYTALNNENTKIQEICLNLIPTIGKLVDRDAMRTQLLPKLLRLILEESVLSIRVQALVCCGKLMPHLEPWMVSNQILPALPKVNSKEPGVLMAILGIYKIAFDTEKFGITTEQCAKSVLPFLITSCVENTLNSNQFEQYMALIKILMQKVETEQRKRLHQLSAAQEEQRNISNIISEDGTMNLSNSVHKSTSSNNAVHLDSSIKDLTDIFGVKDNVPKPSNSNLNVLSLDEKKRLAAEREVGSASKPMSPPIAQPFTSNKSSASHLINIDNLWGSPSLPIHAASKTNNHAAPSPFSPVTKNSTQPDISTADFFLSVDSNNSTATSSNQINTQSFGFPGLPLPPTAGNLVQRNAKTGNVSSTASLDLNSLFNNITVNAQPPSNQTPINSGGGNFTQWNGPTNSGIQPWTSAMQPIKQNGRNPPKDPFDDLLR
ncbi:protein kinase domain-containing protein [Ditylenchus destructor]|nr:protein kinase domain-containing protein [Ditylenchus destructor]